MKVRGFIVKGLAMMLAVWMLAACGSTPSSTPPASSGATAPAASSGDDSTGDTGAVEKNIRIYTNRTESHVAYKVWTDIIAKYQAEVNPGFQVEFETVPNLDQYKDKLKLYTAGDDLPEIFQIDKGPISMELAEQGKIIDIQAELEKVGMADLLNEGCRAYVAHEDGGLYILPEARYGNTYFYWKDKFEAAGVEPPTTFDEFLEVCQKLKAAGEVPLAVTGSASWNLLHVMYGPSWRVTNNEWLQQAKKGEVAFSDIPTAVDSANFLYTLGTNEYFPAGFGTLEYTDVVNGFLGGQYAMVWTQSIYLPQMAEAYDEGRLGYFLIPDNAEYENPYANLAIHTGISWAFNAKTYDAEMARFFEFLVNNYSEACYANDIHSPFDVDPPEDVSQMSKDYYEDMKKQTNCWSNWDDACDPATGTLMGQLAKELAAGMITPEDFLAQLDESVQENGVAYFA